MIGNTYQYLPFVDHFHRKSRVLIAAGHGHRGHPGGGQDGGGGAFTGGRRGDRGEQQVGAAALLGDA